MRPHLELKRDAHGTMREPLPADVAAMQAENRELRELVVALSRLVVKYVTRQN